MLEVVVPIEVDMCPVPPIDVGHFRVLDTRPGQSLDWALLGKV